ncbi:protein translocase subunit SecD [bacterium]|nr:protein translocase subunit SecD [bacterium]
MDRNFKWKVGLTVILSIYLILYTVPTFLGEKTPTWYKHISESKLKLGLDLKGGLSLVYRVEVEDAIVAKLDMIADDINTRLEKNKIELKQNAYANEENLTVSFEIAKDEQKADAKDFALSVHSALVVDEESGNKYTIKFNSREIKEIKKDAVNKAIDTIRRRINSMGIGEQEVVRYGDEEMYSIEVRLPGLKEEDFNNTKEIISKTAQLEFKVVDDDSDVMNQINTANPETPAGITYVTSSYLVDKTGESVPDRFYKTDDIVEADPIKRKALLQKAHKSIENFVKGKAPITHKFGYQLVERGTTHYYRTYLLKKKTVLTGEYISEVGALVDSRNNDPYVSLTFTTIGAEIFERLTDENKHRRMAIVLDDMVDSAPIIQDRISGGRASITLGAGNYKEKVQKAEMLKILLKAGSLPASLTKGEERRVGATLGESSIKSGEFAMAIGAIFVLGFMMIYYRKAGVIAAIALTLNVFFIISIMAFLGATLTLPGIAGIVLTIGMSVDANVIIYERIRDELDAKRPPISAVKYGYEKAFSAIIDANITTMIAGFILYQYGSGPVQGFAVTLIVGILSSLFTAIVVTRMFFDYATIGKKVEKLSI